MKIQSTRARLLASSMICGAAVLAGSQALAAEELVVTGSRIPTQNLTSVSPVAVVNSTEIKNTGTTKIEDLLNSLPQVFASQGSSISNGSTGTAVVQLRGLGSGRTLVLIDGKRLMPGDPGISSQAADLNFIPTALVSSVEIDTGGASSTYGADAVAGVVNFKMLRNFEGVRFTGQYDFYQHNQHGDAGAIAANNARGFKLPGDVTDGAGWNTSLMIGVNAPDGRGNITAYATYIKNNPILEGNRDFSNCTLNSGATFTCGGSSTSDPPRVQVQGGGNFVLTGTGASSDFRPRVGTDLYNFGPTNYYLRPDERYGAGVFAHYELKPWAEVYADFMFMDDSSVAQIAPGGIFFGPTFQVNCDNPLMTPAQRTKICGANANTPTLATVSIGKRNVEGGGRQTDYKHIAYRYVIGMKGKLDDTWSYDGYVQYGTVQNRNIQQNFFLTPRIQNALIVRNVNGAPACVSNDPGCVPYNIWTGNGGAIATNVTQGVTQAALDYLQVPSFNPGRAQTKEWIANLSFTGRLGQYGLKSPWAMDGIDVNFGGEYRQETLLSQSDFLSQSGQLSGAGGAAPPVDNGFNLAEVFGEARIPLVQDMPFFKDLGIETGYRYSSYSIGNKTDTYKLGGHWVPFQGVRFRASYQRSVRAPNILELFQPANVVLDGSTDPCAGLSPGNPLIAKCMSAFNLTQAQVLAIDKNPAPQYNGLTGGNPNVHPEKADSYTWGVVLTPPQVPGLSLSIDYFRILVRDFLTGPAGGNADTFINRCLDNPTPTNFFCQQVHRDPTPGQNFGSLWRTPAGYIIDGVLNTGSLGTSGLDFELNYRTSLERVGLSNAGSVALEFKGTWLNTLETQTLPGDPKFDCTGYYGSVCGTPNPEWRHNARLTWTTPWWGSSVSLRWRYFSSVQLDALNPGMVAINAIDPSLSAPTDDRLGSRNYFDLAFAVTPKSGYTFRFGVNNVFDKDPPIMGANACVPTFCNGNTFPQVYDALGRHFFFSVTADF